MKIIINNFTEFSIDKTKDDISSKTYAISMKNKYFNYQNNEIVLEDVELKKAILDIERLLKGKLLEPKRIIFKTKEISLMLYPRVYNNRMIIDMDIFLKNDEDTYISDYTLTFEKEDIIALYVYLCEIMQKETILNRPDNYKYMFLFVRYLDIDTVKQFCYISDDESIRVGDYVLVDRAGEPSIAIVEQIEFHTKEDSPFTFEKTKEIIRRVDKKEFKNNDDDIEESDEQSYVTTSEFNELKKNFESLKDILHNVNQKLSIKELMKQLVRDDIYSTIFYNKQYNMFIQKTSDIYFIPKYSSSLFTKKELKDLCKESIEIPIIRNNDLSIVYKSAIEICEKENIDYQNDYENKINIIDTSKCILEKIIDSSNTPLEIRQYKYFLESTYENLQLYVRDMDLSENIYNTYKENIGNIIVEKAFVDCTNKIGGIIKNSRIYILSNNITDLSIFEKDTNFGLCVANKDSRFKILDVGTINNIHYIILLHISKDTGFFLKDLSTNVDEYLIQLCKKQTDIDSKSAPLEALTDEWYNRLFFPVGIDNEEKICLLKI